MKRRETSPFTPCLLDPGTIRCTSTIVEPVPAHARMCRWAAAKDDLPLFDQDLTSMATL